MSPRDLRARDRRVAWLERKARLSAVEEAELNRLRTNRDTMWRTLPRRIEARRADLAALETYANEIGLGPV